MTIYVAEIAGRAIAAFNADNDVEAQQQLNDDAFQSDLIVLENEGKSLWDGESEIFLRRVFEDEAERFEARRIVAMKDGQTDGDWLMWLVPVVDPTAFEDDGDDDDGE